MPLTPEQINKIRADAGSPPLTNAGQVPPSPAQPLSIRLGLKSTTTPIKDSSSSPSTGFLDRAGADIQNRGSNVQNAIAGTSQYEGQSPIRRGFEAVNETGKAITDVGYEALPDFAKTGLKAIGDFSGKAIQNAFIDPQFSVNPRDSRPAEVQKKDFETKKEARNIAVAKWAQEHPDASKALDETLGTLGAAGGIAGTILTVNSATQAAQKAVNKGLDVGSNVVQKTGELLKKSGEKLNASAYRPTAEEARLIQNNQIKTKFLEDQLANTEKGTPEYDDLIKQLDDVKASAPTVRSDTALNKGIAGTEKQIGVKAGVEKMKLWKDRIEPALRGSEATISKDELFAKAENRIANEIDPSRKISIQNALDSLKEDYANVDKFNLTDANKLKTALDKFTPAKIFKGQDVSSEIKMIKADMADAIRDKTYNTITDTNIKADYRDYANLKGLQDVGIKAMTEGGKRAGFGTFYSSLKDELTIPVKTIGGKVLYKLGNGLEFIGDKGIKTFGEHLDSLAINDSLIRDPNVTVKAGGKEWTLNDIHSATREIEKLPIADQKILSSFDKIESMKALVENMKLKGAEASDIAMAEKNLRSAIEIRNNDLLNGDLSKYQGSVEQIIDSGGWKEGVKKMFDDALKSGDALTVKALIKQDAVPADYLKTFADKIAKVLKQ